MHVGIFCFTLVVVCFDCRQDACQTGNNPLMFHFNPNFLVKLRKW